MSDLHAQVSQNAQCHDSEDGLTHSPQIFHRERRAVVAGLRSAAATEKGANQTMLKSYLRTHFQSLASIGIRGLSVIAGFLITFFLGHSYGPLANGQYALIAQTAMFLSIVAVGGMDLAVMRQFSATIAFGIPLGRRSLMRALVYSLAAGLIIVVALIVIGPTTLGVLFHGKLPQDAVLLVSVLLMARTTTRLTAAVLRSQEAHLIAQSIEVLVIPATVALLLALHLVAGLQPTLVATAITGLLAACYGVWRCLRFTAVGERALDVALPVMLRSSLPLWATAIALNIADWYSLATAATTLGVYEAGLFRVAFQVGGALSFSAMGMYNVFTARISAAVAVGDVQRVARLGRAATRLALVLLAPVVVGLLLLADPLLGLIGHEFKSAAMLLRIIVFGQVLYIATGPAGLVLAMTGHERLNLVNSLFVTGGLLVAAPLAAHHYGLFGLAIATACVPFAGNIANLLTVYRLEKINVVTGVFAGPPVDPNRWTKAAGRHQAEGNADPEINREFGTVD